MEEGELHFAAGDAAVAGASIVATLSSILGCRSLCMSCWRQSNYMSKAG
jgi:hypothetical protein